MIDYGYIHAGKVAKCRTHLLLMGFQYLVSLILTTGQASLGQLVMIENYPI